MLMDVGNFTVILHQGSDFDGNSHLSQEREPSSSDPNAALVNNL
jgi:hypothetical protein